jgi:hypothetical protein
MSERLHASRVIASRRLLEAVITPGFYIALMIGLLAGYYLVVGFAGAIDSSGFNFQLHPIYDLIARSLSGAFGATFVEKLFAEGPFLFALYVAFLPILLYLAVSSVFRFGLEKNVGAVELLTYGPADGTSYFLAFFLKDVLLTLLSVVVLLAFFAVAAAMNNLVLGPMFLVSLVLIFFAAMAVFAYGILASVLTDSAASSIALFIGFLVLFLLVQMGSFTIVSRYVRSFSGLLSWIINWLSPLFYWNLGLAAAEMGGSGGFLLSLLALLALTGVVLYASHLAMRIRGVRP